MDDEINIIDILKVINKYKLMILALVVIAIAVTASQSLKQSYFYQAKATVIVREGGGDLTSGFNRTLSQFFNVGRGSQSGGILGAIVNSRTLSLAVAQDLQQKGYLEKLFYSRPKDQMAGQENQVMSMESVASMVAGSVNINFDGTLLELTVSAVDPEIAAYLANTYVKNLQEYFLQHSLGIQLNPLDPAIAPRFPFKTGGVLRKIIFAGVVALIIGVMFAFFLNYIKTLTLKEK